MKIKIKDLEKKLGYKIKKNFISVGFDCATTTGVGIISTTKTYAIIDWTLIKFETNNKQELYKRMYQEFKKCISPDTDCCVVEDVFFGMNPDTTIKLSRFGGLVLANAIDKKVHFETIGAKSARAKLFKLDYKKYKGKSKQAVADYLKKLGIKIEEDNVADGLILAILGVIDGIDFRSKKEIAKAKKRK
ncbi:MAG: crossover junction endodeoxyribonuclease RuvC [Candidatus Helarchaeota archaeon]